MPFCLFYWSVRGAKDPGSHESAKGSDKFSNSEGATKRVDPGFPKHPSIGIVDVGEHSGQGSQLNFSALVSPLSFWRVMLIARVPPGSGKAGSGRGKEPSERRSPGEEDEHERCRVVGWGWR